MQYTAADVQEVEISLVRVRPPGAIGNDDAAIVAAIEDLVLVDAEGAQSPPSAIVADPAAHEAGFVVLRFDVRGHPGPWTLKWPGSEAYTVDMR
ncbi:MAG: hypothetical protein RQ731_01910 [Anaerosomatales bacterium]|nr:hypothetical protein [Anaerosomatales bacterium]MDT8433507.1 hypothetical protein [Anaerosomatales bacterium]